MTRMGVLLLAGSLAWAAAPCRADDVGERIVPVAASEPAAVDAAAPAPGTPAESDAPAPAAPAEAEAPAAPEGEANAHWRGGLVGWVGSLRPTGECARRAWDWLTYCPHSGPRWCTGCGRTSAPTCVPPLYTYFLWNNGAGCGGTGGHCEGVAGVAIVPQ